MNTYIYIYIRTNNDDNMYVCMYIYIYVVLSTNDMTINFYGISKMTVYLI